MTETDTSGPVRIAVAGAGGRMGCRIVNLVMQSSSAVITGALEALNHPSIGRDAGIVAGAGELKIQVTADLDRALKGADVLIDFTFPEAVLDHVRAAVERKLAYVVGTTGLSVEHEAFFDEAARSIPLVAAPNMSVGVNLLFRLVPLVAEALGMEYDIEIIESHHNKKKDAPSGTAFRLLDEILKVRKSGRECANFGRHGLLGERDRGEVGVHAVRAGDIAGEHTVIYATHGERIELSHRASSRDTFALGAIRAAEFLAGRQPGRYSMNDVLFPPGHPLFAGDR